MQKFFNFVTKLSEVLGSICIIGISAVIFIGVLTRYVFQTPIAWIEEVSKFLLMFLVYLGIAAVSARGDHLTGDILGALVANNKKFSKIRSIIFEALQAVLMAILAVQTYIFAFKIKPFGQVSAALAMPQWLMILIFAIGITMVLPIHIFRILSQLSDSRQ